MAEEKIIINQITVGQLYRQREDIGTWLDAIKHAESIQYPRWKRLLEVYQRVVLDAVVTSSMRKRIQEATNTELLYINNEGEHDESMQVIIAQPWFLKLLRYILEARFYGHSLVEPVRKGSVVWDINLIPRHHVDRVKGSVYTREYDESSAIPYREGVYSRHLLEIGDPHDLGLLMKVSPYVLYKQGGMGDWSHFAELFGMPMRVYKYNPHDSTSRLEVEKQAQTQGSAAYIIIPEGVEVDTIEAANATGSSDMYDGLRQAMNEEISICLLGNNLTTSNAKTGTYALGDVHMREQSRIHADDLKYVEGVLNHIALDFFQYWGIKLKPGYEFRFDRSEKLTLSQRIDLDTKINAVAPIDPAYFYDKYGVPEAPEKPEQDDPTKDDPEKDDPEPQKTTTGKKPNGHLGDTNQMVLAQHGDDHVCGVNEFDMPVAFTPRLIRLWVKMLDRVYNSFVPESRTDRDMVEATGKMLFDQGFQQGFGTFNLKDADYLSAVHQNLFTFSGAKNLAELKALRDLVYKDGKKLPFTEFRKAAKEIWKEYREDWLKTEYNQVIRAGTMAQQWRDADRTKELYPYLEYKTKGDSRVRPEHVTLNGTIRPIGDFFWQTYFPPNGWNCRCSVRKISQDDIDSGKYQITPDTDAIERGRNAGVEDYWLGNVGKTGLVFRASGHNYFKNLNADELKHVDQVARYWRNVNPITREAGYKPADRIKGPGETYTDIHIDADLRELDKNLGAARLLNGQGYNVRLRPHVEFGPEAIKNPQLEIMVDGKWMVSDRKDPIGNAKNSIQHVVAQAAKQQVGIALLYLPDTYLNADIGKALYNALAPERNKTVKSVWIVKDGKLIVIDRKDRNQIKRLLK